MKIKIKPANIQRVDGRQRAGDENNFELVNHGGRELTKDVDGIDAKPGDVIEVEPEWYETRKHFHFLVPLDEDPAESTEIDLSGLSDANTVKQIKAALDSAGVEYASDLRKADLLELADGGIN